MTAEPPATGSALEHAGRPGLVGYPANLLVAGRQVVVVGAGRIATRKIEGLLSSGADVTVIAPETSDKIDAWEAEGILRCVRRPFAPPDLDDAWLVVTATDVAAVNAAVFAAGEGRRIFVNSADDPVNCSFTLMAVVRQADLVLTIGTGGRSPALATWLRRRFETEFGPEYAVLLDVLSDARESLRAEGRSSEDANWASIFDAGVLELIRAGEIGPAKELVRSCL
jgi:siroheme synthase-like protein